MLEAIGLITFGFFVGAYGTLVGIGGGPLIVPMLALAYRYPPNAVISVSLFAIFFNTLSGTIAYMRQKRVDIVSGTKFGLATIPGAFLAAFAVDYIRMRTFSISFGLFLLALAFYVLARPKESEAPRSRQNPVNPAHRTFPTDAPAHRGCIEKILAERTIEDSMGNVYRYRVNEPAGVGIAALIGAASAFLGIGGGVIQVPALIYLLSFPVHIGTATSHYITAISALFALIPFAAHGDVVYRAAVPLSAGVAAGAQVGARISTKVSGKDLVRLLTPVFILMGTKLLFFG
ncbi:MAG: sulfite exporter TauE/SafE family protein [bacterium]